MGLNPYLLELAKASIKRGNFEVNAPPLMPIEPTPAQGPTGKKKVPAVKQADVPPTPLSAPTATPGMPPPPATPPTNGTPPPPAEAAQFGSVSVQPIQQTDQAQPPVTTSSGASVPQPPQGAMQRAPGLVKQHGS